MWFTKTVIFTIALSLQKLFANPWNSLKKVISLVVEEINYPYDKGCPEASLKINSIPSNLASKTTGS
jgi:hypothetical protein